MPQALTSLPHEVDHIRARKHHGPTALENLCWSCAHCNGAKGSDASGFDTDDTLVPLFNPRKNRGSDHFQWRCAEIVGRTANGRATIGVLRINDPSRIALRALLMAANLYPRE
jgi:hypothetical protein